MLYIAESTGHEDAPVMLTKKQIQVNNIKLIHDNHEFTIETKGKWSGSIQELLSLIKELTTND